MCVYVCVCVYTHTHTYIYICIIIYIYIYKIIIIKVILFMHGKSFIPLHIAYVRYKTVFISQFPPPKEIEAFLLLRNAAFYCRQ